MSKTVKMFALATIILSFLFVGCTRYANEDELKILADQQAAVKKAESKLANLKKDRRNLEAKLTEAETKLKEAKEEKSAVESRLK